MLTDTRDFFYSRGSQTHRDLIASLTPLIEPHRDQHDATKEWRKKWLSKWSACSILTRLFLVPLGLKEKKSFAAMETLRAPLQIIYYESAINSGLLVYNIDQDASIGALVNSARDR